MNGSGVITEVGQFTVPAADMPWETVLDNPDVTREEFIQMVLAESLTYKELKYSQEKVKIPKFWERYKRKYSWTVNIEGTVKPLRVYLKNLNGEQEYINLLKQSDNYVKGRAVPDTISIDFQSQNTKIYNVKVKFDEDEMVEIYEKMNVQPPSNLITLQIEIEDDTKHVVAYVLNKKYKVAVEKAIFKLTAY